MRSRGGNNIGLVLLTAGGTRRATLAQIHGPHLGGRATLPVTDPCGDALPQYIISDLRSEGFLACLSTLICVAAANLEASELLSHSRVGPGGPADVVVARLQKKGTMTVSVGSDVWQGRCDKQSGLCCFGLWRGCTCVQSYSCVGNTSCTHVSLTSVSKWQFRSFTVRRIQHSCSKTN